MQHKLFPTVTTLDSSLTQSLCNAEKEDNSSVLITFSGRIKSPLYFSSPREQFENALLQHFVTFENAVKRTSYSGTYLKFNMLPLKLNVVFK